MRLKYAHILILWLIIANIFPVNVFAETTQEKLDRINSESDQIKEEISQNKEEISDLTYSKDKMELLIRNMTDEINTLTDETELIANQLNEIQKALEETTISLNEAENIKDRQYNTLKHRIRQIYMNSMDTSELESIIKQEGFASLINKDIYIKSAEEFDLELFEKYKESVISINSIKKELSLREEELSKTKAELDKKNDDMWNIISGYRDKLSGYKDALCESIGMLSEAEEQLEENEDITKELEKQIEEEKKAAEQNLQTIQQDMTGIITSAGDREMLAAIIYCEAGCEPWEGKVAVGGVVLNRVRSPRFPSTISAVLKAPGQFTPVGSGKFYRVLAQGAPEDCFQAADAALSGQDPSGGRLFFHRAGKNESGYIIGHHIFK